MFSDLYDALSMLWSWRWPIADGEVTEVYIMRCGREEERAKLGVIYKFSIGEDGPYTGESLWEPPFLNHENVIAARRKIRTRQKVRVRYRPDDPSVDRLDGSIPSLLEQQQRESRKGAITRLK